MDVRKFSIFIIIAGLLAALAGGFTFLRAQSFYESRYSDYRELVKRVDPDNYLTKSEQMETIGQKSGYVYDFQEAESGMTKGKMIALGGGLVLVLGIGLLISAKKPQPQAL